jgi:hypothetical protein
MPAAIVSLAARLMAPTLKPAPSMVVLALASAWPTTLGTATGAFTRRHDEADGGTDGGLETRGRILADDVIGSDGLAGIERNVTDSQTLSRAGHAGVFDLDFGIQLGFADHVRNCQQRGSRRYDEVDGGTGGGQEASDGILADDVAFGNGGTGALSNGSDFQAEGGTAGHTGVGDVQRGGLLGLANYVRYRKPVGYHDVDGGARGGRRGDWSQVPGLWLMTWPAGTVSLKA